jgi:hypothetical protein
MGRRCPFVLALLPNVEEVDFAAYTHMRLADETHSVAAIWKRCGDANKKENGKMASLAVTTRSRH